MVTMSMHQWSPKGSGRLPVDGQERTQVVAIGHTGQAGEDVLEVRERILAVPLAGDDERVNDGRALAGVGVADKEPVLLPDAGRPDRILDEVVVQLALAVVQMRGERPPLAKEVIARFAERGLREHALPRPPGKPPEAETKPKGSMLTY
jgi:hypothetical protein